MTIFLESENKVFSGWHRVYRHQSQLLNCTMRFALYVPPIALTDNYHPPLCYWLSGLTCTHENFMQKAGALRVAAQCGIAIIAPDTSPRGEGVPDDPQEQYDLGLGAGFYVNASQDPWQRHYQMYDYIMHELPAVVHDNFTVRHDKTAILGHSMGGHGALVMALRQPQRFASVSAFSPICNPMQCAWGKKAFTHYLGDKAQNWQIYDATRLLENFDKAAVPMLIDQGSQDEFLAEQLCQDEFVNIAKNNNYPLQYRLQEGYDHSYYFISSFIEDHLLFHAKHLQ